MRTSLVAASAVTALLLGAAPAAADARAVDDSCPAEVPSARFSDVPSTNAHARTIDCVVHWHVARGTGDGAYSPGSPVTRGQMATFIARTITESGGSLPADAPDAFSDDDGTTHEASANALAAEGVVAGKGGGRYAPQEVVSRDQMATFLVRAFEHRTGTVLPEAPDAFDDDEGSTHEANVDRAAAAGFAGGVGVRQYAPAAPVRRDQMASFLSRVLDKLVEEDYSTVPPAGEPVLLARTPEAAGEECFPTPELRIGGETYEDSLLCRAFYTTFIEYDLGGQFRRFTALAGQVDGQVNQTQTIRVRVLGDGRELTSHDLSYGPTQELDLDLTGVDRLRLEIENITPFDARGTANSGFALPTVYR